MGGFLAGRVTKRQLKMSPGTGKRGHDRTDRNRSNGGNLLVRTPFQLAEHDDLPIAWRQGLESVGKAVVIVTCDSKGFGCCAWGPVQLFVELGHVFHAAILIQPGVTGVPDDLQQPAARTSAMKAMEETVRAQHRFLRGVFGIRAAAQKPAREIKSGIEMR